MASESKKRSIIDVDDGAGPAKQQRIETTPMTLGDEAVRTLLSSLLVMNQMFISATNLQIQVALLLAAAAKNEAATGGAIAQIEAMIGEKVERLKKQSGTAADNSIKLFKKQYGGIIGQSDLDRASELTPTNEDDATLEGGIQKDGSKSVAQHSNNKETEITHPVAAEARPTSSVVAAQGEAQAPPPPSARPTRPLRPLRRYPGPLTGHLYKPHAVTLLDGSVHIVWYPK